MSNHTILGTPGLEHQIRRAPHVHIIRFFGKVDRLKVDVHGYTADRRGQSKQAERDLKAPGMQGEGSGLSDAQSGFTFRCPDWENCAQPLVAGRLLTDALVDGPGCAAMPDPNRPWVKGRGRSMLPFHLIAPGPAHRGQGHRPGEELVRALGERSPPRGRRRPRRHDLRNLAGLPAPHLHLLSGRRPGRSRRGRLTRPGPVAPGLRVARLRNGQQGCRNYDTPADLIRGPSMTNTTTTTTRPVRRREHAAAPASPHRSARCQVCGQGKPIWRAADRWRCPPLFYRLDPGRVACGLSPASRWPQFRTGGIPTR